MHLHVNASQCFFSAEKLATWKAAEMTHKSDTDSMSVVIGEKKKRIFRLAAALKTIGDVMCLDSEWLLMANCL